MCILGSFGKAGDPSWVQVSVPSAGAGPTLECPTLVSLVTSKLPSFLPVSLCSVGGLRASRGLAPAQGPAVPAPPGVPGGNVGWRQAGRQARRHPLGRAPPAWLTPSGLPAASSRASLGVSSGWCRCKQVSFRDEDGSPGVVRAVPCSDGGLAGMEPWARSIQPPTPYCTGGNRLRRGDCDRTGATEAPTLGGQGDLSSLHWPRVTGGTT